jgi:hypothetical protein
MLINEVLAVSDGELCTMQISPLKNKLHTSARRGIIREKKCCCKLR